MDEQQSINQDKEFQSYPPQEKSLQLHQPDPRLWMYVLVGLVIIGGLFGFWWWQRGELIPTLPVSTLTPTLTPMLTTTPTPTPTPTPTQIQQQPISLPALINLAKYTNQESRFMAEIINIMLKKLNE